MGFRLYERSEVYDFDLLVRELVFVSVFVFVFASD